MARDLASARVAVRNVLARVRSAIPESATDTLVQALCDGLRTIPVQARVEALTRWLEGTQDPEAFEPVGIPAYMAYPPLLTSPARALHERATPAPSHGLRHAATALQRAAEAASPSAI